MFEFRKVTEGNLDLIVCVVFDVDVSRWSELSRWKGLRVTVVNFRSRTRVLGRYIGLI